MHPGDHAGRDGPHHGSDQRPRPDARQDLQAVVAATPDPGCRQGDLVVGKAGILEFSKRQLSLGAGSEQACHCVWHL